MIDRSRLLALQTKLVNLISYLYVIVFSWAVGVKLPNYLFLLYLSLKTPGAIAVGTVGIFSHYILLSMSMALGIATYSAIGIRTLLLLRSYLKRIWEVSVPPYTVESTIETQRPITWKKSTVRLKNKIHWFKIWMGVSIAILPPIVVLYFRWLQWNTESIANVLNGASSAEVLFSFAYLLSAPIMTLLPEYTSGMNTISLVGTATLVWIPAVPLTLAILNLNSFIYDLMNRYIFRYVDSYLR